MKIPPTSATWIFENAKEIGERQLHIDFLGPRQWDLMEDRFVCRTTTPAESLDVALAMAKERAKDLLANGFVLTRRKGLAVKHDIGVKYRQATPSA